MDNTLRVGKRVFSALVAFATVASMLGLASLSLPQRASAAVAGDLIRGTSHSAVYFYGYDGERYAFPNEKTYSTWRTSFSGVQTISDSQLENIQLGGNVEYRPGTRWVKITSNPKTYAVAPDGRLHWIESEAVASAFAGSDWNQSIDDVPDVFWSDYTEGTSLMSAAAFEGMLYVDGGTRYLVEDGAKREITASGMTANHYQAKFFLDGASIDDSGLSTGSAVTGAECNLLDASQTGCSDVVATGAITLSASSSTPAGATLPKGANSVKLFSFNVSAGSEAAVFNQVALTLEGLSDTAVLTNVYLYEGANRLTDARSFNSSTRQVTFGSLKVNLNPGQTKTITVRADIRNEVDIVGKEVRLSVKTAADVNANGGSVGGSFPITGNLFTFANVSLGSVEIEDSGTIQNPALGAQDATIAQFRVRANGTEDVSLQELTLKIEDAADHSDFKLWDGGSLLATGSSSGKNLVTFTLSGLAIAKGNSKLLKVTADIGGEATDTIKVYVDNNADVVAVGDTYNFGVSVTNNYGSGDAQTSTIVGGELTLTHAGPTAGKVRVGAQDQELLRFTITAAQEITLNDLDVILYGDDDDNDPFDEEEDAGADADADADGLIGDGEYHLTDISLVNTATGARVAGPLELSGTNDAVETVAFSNIDWLLKAGETVTLAVTVDIDDDVADGTAFAATLDISSLVAEDVNGDELEATDIVPSSNIVGYIQEAIDATLTFSLASTPGDVSTIQGAQGVVVNRFNVVAGEGGDITVSEITITVYGDDFGGDTDFTPGGETDSAIRDFIQSCSIYDKAGSLIGGPKGMPTTGGDVVFNNLNWVIDANEVQALEVRCNLANPSETDDEYFAFDISDAIAQDDDGQEVTPSGFDANGDTTPINVVTIAEKGTLAVAVDASSPSAKILLANSTGNHVASFRFTATGEDFTVKKLTLTEEAAGDLGLAAAAYTNNVSTITLGYKDAAGAAKTAQASFVSNEATFTGLSLHVDTDASSVVTVSVDVPKTDRVSGGAATSNEAINIGLLDGAGEFEATGVASGITLVDVSDITDTARHIVRETVPTLSKSVNSPAGSGHTPGLNTEILRFNMAAAAGKDVVWSNMLFTFSATTSGDWNDCDNLLAADFKLYSSKDGFSSPIAATWTPYIAGVAACGTDEDVAFAQVAPAVPEGVAAGSTVTYKIVVDTTGASADDIVAMGLADHLPVAHANFLAAGELAGAAAVTDTVLTMDAGDGDLYAPGDIVCNDNEDNGCDADDELMLVVAAGGTDITVIRGYLNTVPVAAGEADDDMDRIPGSFLWQDDGSASVGNALTEYWGSYLVPGTTEISGSIRF